MGRGHGCCLYFSFGEVLTIELIVLTLFLFSPLDRKLHEGRVASALFTDSSHSPDTSLRVSAARAKYILNQCLSSGFIK